MEISVQKMSEEYAGSFKNTVERTQHHISDLAALNQILDERKAYLRLLQARRELEAIRKEIDAISNKKEKDEDAANTREDKEKKEDREVCAQRVLMQTSVDDLGDIRSEN